MERQDIVILVQKLIPPNEMGEQKDNTVQSLYTS